MMQINPHLTFNGTCEAAFKFYAEVLDGKIQAMMPYGDTPLVKEMPADWRQKICHATLTWGGMRITGADVPSEQYQKPQGFSVLLSIDGPERADHLYMCLAKDAVVQMEIQKTFWALRFAMLTDRFGTPWIINCERHEGP